MRLRAIICIFFLLLAQPLPAAEAPGPGKVSVVNLSDGHCVPCKMMTGLLEKMQAAYGEQIAAQTLYPLKDKAVDAKYSPKTLPTLVFFDRKGQEAFRHAGIMEEAEVRALLDRLLKE